MTRKLVAVVLLSLALGGCSGDDPASSNDNSNGGNVTNPSFAADVAPLLASRCAVAGYHAGSAPAQGLDLTASESYQNIVDVTALQSGTLKRVSPDDAENSYLVMKVEGRAPSGTRMPPPPRPALSASEIQMIRNWIDQGAQDN